MKGSSKSNLRPALRCTSCVLLFALVALATTAYAEDCEPKRNCDATRDCSRQEDTRSCGHDVDWGWFGKHHVNDPLCEAQKAAQNAGYAAAKATCEAQKSAEKLDCERVKSQMKLACEVGLDGPFSCTSGEVMGQLRTARQDGLTDFDELSGAVTTPIKKAGGQLSWRETACQTSGAIGTPYRNSQRSTDGFCTIDVKLTSFAIQSIQMPSGDHFIRIEALPGGKAANICKDRTISTRDAIQFGGPIKIDKHPGQRWLEVHVTDDFGFYKAVSANQDTPPGSKAAVSEPNPGASYVIAKGDCLAKIAQRAYGRQIWRRIYSANRTVIKDPDLIFPGESIRIPQ